MKIELMLNIRPLLLSRGLRIRSVVTERASEKSRILAAEGVVANLSGLRMVAKPGEAYLPDFREQWCDY